jgi:hypothetical protein
MVRREIEIDEDTNRLLTELAAEYKGDLSSALADLVNTRAKGSKSSRNEAKRRRKVRCAPCATDPKWIFGKAAP